MMMRTLIATLATGSALLIAGGCGGGNSTVTLEQAIDHYDARRYSLSRQQAAELRQTSTGPSREQSAYVAGLSAYQLGELEEARSYLMTASQADDNDTAGRANAQLGLLELDRNRPATAAGYFEIAAGRLDGAAARQAAQHAASAHQLAGNYTEAQRWLKRSTVASSATSVHHHASATAARYVLQAGAFESRARAERTAREIELIAQSHRLGPVRIVHAPTSRGTRLHMVQFGGFQHRDEANRVRSELGRLEVIVVATR